MRCPPPGLPRLCLKPSFREHAGPCCPCCSLSPCDEGGSERVVVTLARAAWRAVSQRTEQGLERASLKNHGITPTRRGVATCSLTSTSSSNRVNHQL